MEIVAVRELLSRAAWGLLVVLLGDEIMLVGEAYGRGWSEIFLILIADIFFRGYYLQYNNHESVIVNGVIPVHQSN